MVTYKRKKVTKYRAHTTHGGGHRKKRRGAGSRGGRGRAGSGKRAGHKKYGITLGRHGFVPRRTVGMLNTLNVGYFTNEKIAQLLASGQAHKEGQYISINLAQLGYSKLLGAGNTAAKLKLLVPQCTPRAAEKVKAAGGEVTVSEAGEKTSE
ncbi:uL15 family ribosomal protein [Candidatus Woesearchaeota archaeon]|nr:uL15 family ribosomal protein [Candidatus Woesearchaeota archaeon]